ncbi:MAG: glycosyltransferase [Phycisphaerales bacterium]|nr:glycosyltransferase [Phycisphaerales bacterium]
MNRCNASQAGPVTVICTVRNDAPGLRIMLESLSAQTRTPDEIIIVDGGSDPDTVPELQSIVAACPNARLLIEPDVNIAQGRNIAIGEARHGMIACIDAGCRARPDWLAQLLAPFADDAARIEVVGGATVAAPRLRFQRVVAALTLPGHLRPVDPATFNPSARSLAFRRSAWHRASGFPEWLMTAEDTLFDLRLRGLQPSVRYAFAADAIVEWEPRATWRATWRQFSGYARGEAHIGRGREDHRYTGTRYAALAAWAIAATTFAVQGWNVGACCAGMMALLLLLRPHLRSALLAAVSTTDNGLPRAGLFRRIPRIAYACVVSEFIALACWRGHRAGMRDRARLPELFERELREYLQAADSPIDLASVPPWNVEPSPPRTLIVSWHWPPANRASANVLSNLFQHAPPDRFRVLTRRMNGSQEEGSTSPALPTERLAWPLQDDRPVRFRTWLAEVRTLAAAVRAAWRIHRDWDVQCVVSVHPTRYGLLAGRLAAKTLGVPHVAYMHDLLRETLITSSRLKRAFWSAVDTWILRASRHVLVPTREHADHYAGRGIKNTWVLPHTAASLRNDADAKSENASDELQPAQMLVQGGDRAGGVAPESAKTASLRARLCNAPSAAWSNHGTHPLHLVYSGAIYEPHTDAVEALIRAARSRPHVRLRFLSQPQPLLVGQDVQWLLPERMREALRLADACVVALGWKTPYPDEIRICFPSKILDYLQAGRPILAIVPRGCFVDRLVRETGCGICANSPDPLDIQHALRMLMDDQRRLEYACNAARALARFEPRSWMRRLGALLAGCNPSSAEAATTSVVARSDIAFERPARTAHGSPVESITG